MFGDDILVRTLLLPPRLPRRWLARDRLDYLLSTIVDYPLTVVSASAGYGKSMALASFASHAGFPSMWYTLGEGCDDPLVFLVHLVHACRALMPQAGERALSILQHGGSGTQVWAQALDSLINDLVAALDGETALILDDYHTVDDRPEIRALIERLITMRPPQLHIVLATRRRPQLACMPTLQVRGELLELSEQDLAFTQDEIDRLFSTAYGRDLGPEEAPAVTEQTGGWAIALQMIWQSRENSRRPVQGPPAAPVQDHSKGLFGVEGSREALFAYLAQEVLARQPRDVQSFLLRTSILLELDPEACDAVLETKGSRAQLETLYRRGLFLTALGGGLYRYHPLFHSFLQEQAAGLPEWAGLHRRAARYYREAGLGEQALYHFLATGDTSTAAMELERWAEPWLESGRAVTLLEWIDQLPGEALSMHPQLLVAQGDAARLLARFDAALQAYRQAGTLYEEQGDALGMARALRGEGVIYLDTVEPAQAEALLRRAFKLLPPGEAGARAELLGLIAENRLNRGRADQALRILDIEFGTAEGERAPVESALANLSSKVRNRALVRLGRLAEARGRLEAAALPTRSESPASELTLLSLIGALEGDPEAALRYAQMGLEAARHAGSALFEAEAYICAGHALQLARPDDYRTANEYYLQALGAADTLHVANTGAEAYMGLALLHGFHGDVAAASAAAREGLAIAGHSGNEWAAAQLWLVLGAAATANGSPEAEGHLARALAGSRTSKDAYGQAAAHMWLSIRRYRTGDQEQAAHYAISAFELVQRYGYAGLLTGPTLFGPRDRMMLVPVLLAVRSDPAHSNEAQMLLNRGFPEIAADDNTRTYHPGVTLRIQTLGPLRVWRGMDEIRPQEWQRKKSQQMLGLLLTNRDRWLQREQICDLLWPGESSAEAEAQFKVTLNGLNAALEPLRPSRTPPFYVRRQGGAYRFYPPDGVWLDVEAFEAQMAAARALRTRSAKPGRDSAQSGNPSAMQDALANVVSLHQGEYLSDWLYEDWARDERERLEALYMEAAVLLAETLVERGDLPEAIRLCDLVLARDPGWEDAYCVLMRAYAMQGQRRMALATYDRCVRNLRQWLDVDPLPSTVRIYEELKA